MSQPTYTASRRAGLVSPERDSDKLEKWSKYVVKRGQICGQTCQSMDSSTFRMPLSMRGIPIKMPSPIGPCTPEEERERGEGAECTCVRACEREGEGEGEVSERQKKGWGEKKGVGEHDALAHRGRVGRGGGERWEGGGG